MRVRGGTARARQRAGVVAVRSAGVQIKLMAGVRVDGLGDRRPRGAGDDDESGDGNDGEAIYSHSGLQAGEYSATRYSVSQLPGPQGRPLSSCQRLPARSVSVVQSEHLKPGSQTPKTTSYDVVAKRRLRLLFF